MKLVPGTVLERYRVEEEIGRGGMARVYRVRHQTLRTVHALKVLSLSGDELRERLVREGQVQAQLDHPHIVAVRDILDLPDGPGLLMDYIEGEALDHWLVSHQPSPAERQQIFMDIADGVGFAHARGVVHRDLKPGNVIMQQHRGQWIPRVADFGLAKLIAGEEPDGTLQSSTGRPMGTPAYMAPEQVRSSKHVDARADVFALGCILYELFCGQRAFGGHDTLEVFNRIARGQFTPPRSLTPDLDPRIEQAIVGALTVDVGQRIPSCEVLCAVLRGDEVWIRSPSNPSETWIGQEFVDTDPAEMPGTLDPTIDGPGPVAVDDHPSHALRSQASLASADTVVRGSARPAWALPAVVMACVLLLTMAFVAGQRSSAPAPVTPAPVEAMPTGSMMQAPDRPHATGAHDPSSAVPVPTPGEPAPEPMTAAEPPTETPVASKDPSPEPRGLPAGAGRVRIRGDAMEVSLLGSDGTPRPPGTLPAGSYIVQATFAESPAMHAGNLELRAGQTVTLTCSADTLLCSP